MIQMDEALRLMQQAVDILDAASTDPALTDAERCRCAFEAGRLSREIEAQLQRDEEPIYVK